MHEPLWWQGGPLDMNIQLSSPLVRLTHWRIAYSDVSPQTACKTDAIQWQAALDSVSIAGDA